MALPSVNKTQADLAGKVSLGVALGLVGFLLLVAVGLGFLLWGERVPPNVVLITLDTTRADRLGCYGYPKETSPCLDRLAEEGVVFDFALAQAAVTPVSHASILTGLNPYRHGVRVIHGKAGYRLSTDHPTLTTLLKEAGWKTAAFLSAFPVSEYYGFHHGFDKFISGISKEGARQVGFDEEGKFTWSVTRNQRRAEVTTQEARRWLRKRKKPFFLWVHYFDPHDPTLMPPDHIVEQFRQDASKNSREDRLKLLYDAEIFYMDQQIGSLLERLRETGHYDNTIFIVVADHGEGLGDHDWWYHRALYQEQLRLPLIIRLPEGPSGVRVKELVRSIDILPTVLEALDLPIPSGVEGKSLLKLMEGRGDAPRFAYADAINLLDNNLRDGTLVRNQDLMYCVTDGTWKLIHRQFNPDQSELYNLKTDPGELRNVIDQYPKEHERLMQLLEQTGGRIDELIEAAPENPDVLQRLKDLGYIK
jgi:arylsulfatase A-like enzyme